MPNWCDNTLVITGKKADRDRLVAQVCGAETAFSFENIIVPPSTDAYHATCSPSVAVDGCALDRDDDTGGYKNCPHGLGSAMSDPDNWYNWNVRNWGTKWDAHAESPMHDEFDTIYRFDTAWAPPILVIEALAAQYPTLNFDLRYAEGGMGYIGQSIFENGKNIQSGEWQRDDEPTVEVESWHGDQMFVSKNYFDNGMRIWGSPEFLTLGG